MAACLRPAEHAVILHQLHSGSSLVLAARGGSFDPEKLALVLGGGRGCVLRADIPLAGLWMPLRGRLQLNGGAGEGVLLPGEVRVTEPEAGISAVGRGSAVWVALLGSRTAWRRALERLTDLPLPEPLLLPT